MVKILRSAFAVGMRSWNAEGETIRQAVESATALEKATNERMKKAERNWSWFRGLRSKFTRAGANEAKMRKLVAENAEAVQKKSKAVLAAIKQEQIKDADDVFPTTKSEPFLSKQGSAKVLVGG